MDHWVEVFGQRVRPLLVEPRMVRLTDRRELGLHSEFGTDFDQSDMDAFIAGFIEPSRAIEAERVPARLRTQDDEVVVNVRRGDYFTDPANRAKYAFDVDEYLVEALAVSRRTGGTIGKMVVVSDGIDWCKQHLAWLADHCNELVWEDQGPPPEVHLAFWPTPRG